MYVEERLAQLENVTSGHGKQIEMVADGLASLTNRVDLGFKEVREEFGKVDRRFAQLEGKVGRIEIKLTEHDERFDRIDQRFEQVDKRFEQIGEQFVQLHGVLTELVTLVKNKL
ncbi:hypothetical protein LZG74_03505 [Dyadobacter sp. CY327]|uniref:hypothetical protein n=1 Tax=Dyadobacter sp. CY327 TaxID=2907301 RepID=UPI001F41CE00|nr:hypothetical protein [Dyadobacter sp. CY327]MCE7069351.1 hypothetical protein [Dyadobacter sp. CY327]